MNVRLKSIEEFYQLQKSLKNSAFEKAQTENPVTIRVSEATCGIASGAKEIERYLQSELRKRNIGADIIPVGCMGYCYAEPTIEVTLPGKEPVVFGYVDTRKADEIIEQYIRNNQIPDGAIPVNYELP